MVSKHLRLNSRVRACDDDEVILKRHISRHTRTHTHRLSYTMAIYSFWIYDRHCNCIYTREWAHYRGNSTQGTSSASASGNATTNRGSIGSNVTIGTANLNNVTTPVNPKALEIALSGTVNSKNEDHEAKLLFGTLFSIRKIAMSLASNTSNGNSDNVRNDDIADFNRGSLNKFNELKSFSTLKYKCHFYESLNGLKFVLLSDPNIDSLQFVLMEIYNKFYLNFVVRNPLMQVEFRSEEVISNPVFIESVDNYISTLPSFIS